MNAIVNMITIHAAANVVYIISYIVCEKEKDKHQTYPYSFKKNLVQVIVVTIAWLCDGSTPFDIRTLRANQVRTVCWWFSHS